MPQFTELKTKKARTAHIRNMLGTNAAWALKGLLKIYEAQTTEEQAIGATVVHNMVGFTGADSNLLSSFAEQVKHGRTMSNKQMALIYKKIPKYARQLEAISYRVGA